MSNASDRPPNATSAIRGTRPLALETVRALVRETCRPRCFFAGNELALSWDEVAKETVSWELYRGRLLDPAHTRQERTFNAWNIWLHEGDERSAEPLLSVKLDPADECLYVIRGVL